MFTNECVVFIIIQNPCHEILLTNLPLDQRILLNESSKRFHLFVPNVCSTTKPGVIRPNQYNTNNERVSKNSRNLLQMHICLPKRNGSVTPNFLSKSRVSQHVATKTVVGCISNRTAYSEYASRRILIQFSILTVLFRHTTYYYSSAKHETCS